MEKLRIKEFTLGEGKLIYIPHWADDPETLFSEAKKLSFTPDGTENTMNAEVRFGATDVRRNWWKR